MNITLTQDSRKYARIIFDVIRVFLPQLRWQQLIGEEAAENILFITVDNSEIVVGLCDGPCIVEDLENSDENEVKRTIKLAVYRFFTEILMYKASPWGILTGIRPTKIVHRFWEQDFTKEKIIELLQGRYLLASEKAEKLIQITQLQRKYLLDAEAAKKLVSIYISIPFCPTRCSYCSFPAFSTGPKELENYLQYLLKEIKAVGEAINRSDNIVQTIYVGGGTPTTLNLKQLRLLLNGIKESFFSKATIEYTFEAGRPDTIDEEKLALLLSYQVNRISINPQTMWAKTLQKIGRNHSPQDILEKFKMARNIGFKNINMDLIIGLPNEGVENIKYTLGEIGKLKPENLTLHALAIKRTAKLQRKTETDGLDNQVEEMFAFTEDWCKDNGYLPYYLYRQKQITGNQENIGYSLGGQPCIYNIQMIEERQTIWGLGVGAGTKIVDTRDWTLKNTYNPKDLIIYCQRIDEIIKTKVDKILGLG
ncbi:MAG: hypothetical protein JM58_11665 [Peptococcaceae bacterium BICA1-8]|nr:MAG: hypothetical protein JM58_11665 [Peptococcaceae bacterium BICA1-8]